MNSLIIKLIVLFLILSSCNKTVQNHLLGIYISQDGTKLEVLKDFKFVLKLPQESTKIGGNYIVNNNKMILEIENNDEKLYSIQIPPQTKIDGYEFMIRGKDWGRLSGVHCKIEQNGKIVQEVFSDEHGIVKFEYFKAGKLVIGGIGWEHVQIDLSEISYRSAIIEIEREKFREYPIRYELAIKNLKLIGLNNTIYLKQIKSNR